MSPISQRSIENRYRQKQRSHQKQGEQLKLASEKKNLNDTETTQSFEQAASFIPGNL